MNWSPNVTEGYRGHCAMCGTALHVSAAEWHRELGCCPHCGLNARLRGIVVAFSRVVYREMSAPLVRMPARRGLRVLGISDHEAYASVLASRFQYINTHYHREPLLDICDATACLRYAGNDVLICSDVLEHAVLKPPSVIKNLLSMLAPGGALILTAPTFDMNESIEWYGGLRAYRVEQRETGTVLLWDNIRGQTFLDDAPIFHGGSGATAELRLISHQELASAAIPLAASVDTVGFQQQWGYSWPLTPQFPYLAAPADGRVMILRK
jgi:hypothetical protein